MSDLSLQRVGPTFGGSGTAAPFRGDMTGAQVVADAHGRYAEASRRGTLFIAHNVAAQAVSVALATTYTGLCISNPLGNKFNLELLGAGFALTVAPAAIASIHVIGGFSLTANVTHTTPLAAPGIQSTLLGGGNVSTAKADSAATIPTPGYILPMQGGFTAAALPSSPIVWTDIAGLITVAPGGFVCIGALTAITGFGAFAWEETPILP
jgi:hypothetical protein